jgi:hypothetical protein
MGTDSSSRDRGGEGNRKAYDRGMTASERQILTDLRRALLHLHKTLLEWERAAYERMHGRVSGHELLRAILNDPQFVWLRPVSELIVRIDETLENDLPTEPAKAGAASDVAAIIAQVRTLVVPDETGTPYAQRYHMALQEHPDAVFAHRGVTAVLKEVPPPRTH